jgi:hypothetical protein
MYSAPLNYSVTWSTAGGEMVSRTAAIFIIRCVVAPSCDTDDSQQGPEQLNTEAEGLMSLGVLQGDDR